MKKLLLVCLINLPVVNAMEMSVWKGAPDALRKAAQSSQVMHALDDLSKSVANLMTLYVQQLAPTLTQEQKEKCTSILFHAKKMIQKSYELSQKGGNDSQLQQEIQEMGQELFLSYFPLLMTIQQEVTDQVAAQIEHEMQDLAAKGYGLLDNAVDSMIQVLQ